jgi:glycosyltransferase involved in cell wall biosynthesis
MILGINGIRLIGPRSGVGRCIEMILRCMGELDHPFHEIRVYTPEPLEESIKLPPRARNVVLPSQLPLGLWEQIRLPKAHGNKELLFCPSYMIPVFARCPTLLVHHGSYEGYPPAFPWWPRTKARMAYQLSARRATVVCTVSQHSKRDLIRFYGLAAETIHVIPEGVDTQLFRPLKEAARLANWRRRIFGADVPFFLYVGKPTKRRNLPNLLQAFRRLKRERGLPHKLLLVGTALAGQTLRPLVRELQPAQDIVSLGFASHEELVLAYNACAMLVYPSSYEGFGMPVLEAMACGAPVIALNNTAFPEFAGGVAHLVEDAEADTLQAAMGRLLDDSTWRDTVSRLGPQRAADYDWHGITKRYIALMREVVAA